MSEQLHIVRAPRFCIFFRRLNATETDMALVYTWVLRLGWVEVRRWNDELLDLLEIAQEEVENQPARITQGDPEPPGKE
jgi:hypothetical protein